MGSEERRPVWTMLKKREWQVLGELVGFFPLVLSGEFYLGFLFVFKIRAKASER